MKNTKRKENLNMTLEEVKMAIATIGKGKLTHVTYEKTENGYTKTTTMVCRFINYYNMKSVKESGKTQAQAKPNPNIQTIIEHILTYNTNTQNYLLHCYPLPNQKSKSIYKDNNGNEITKEQYQAVVPPKKTYGNPSPVRQIKIQDLVKIG